MKKEHFQKGWGLFVEEFLKKPVRMAVLAIISGILITGGNFVVGRTSLWLGKVINMNKRVTSVEVRLSEQVRADSLLQATMQKQYGVLMAVRDELIEIRGAMRARGIYVSRRPRGGGSLDDLIGDLESAVAETVAIDTTSRRPR